MYGREFAFFLQVCKDGSIRKAAKSLYISPQGLGKALINLEHDLDIQLFERGKNGIHLTKYGEAIKPYAQNIVDNIYAMNQSIGKLNKQISGTLNLACSLGVPGALNPSIFSDFQMMYPETTLNIIDGTDLRIQDMIATKDDFIGISVGPYKRKGLEERFLSSHNLVLLINKNNPLAAKEKIEFSDLKDEPMIMYTDEFAAYHNIMACCKKAGFTPNIVYYITEAIMAYKFCKKYNALAFTVDFIAEDIFMEDIVVKPIFDEECKWRLYLINKTNQKLSEVQQAFVNHLLKEVGQLQSNNGSKLELGQPPILDTKIELENGFF